MLLTKSLLMQALPDVVFYDEAVFNTLDTQQLEVSFSIDSRSFESGDIFIALPGAKIDGHFFIQDVVEKGAGGLIIQDTSWLKNISSDWFKNHPVIIVKNSYQALINLAKFWRSQLTIPVVGVTGSIGKTTTKEMLRHILTCAGKKVHASWKNQNTDIGLSLNLLKTRLDHDVVVLEMGIDAKGEMAVLASIAQPTIGIITAIAHSHGQFLGTLSDVAYEKRQIFSFFSSENIGVIAGDQPLLADICYNHSVVKFGFKTKNQVQARKVALVYDEHGDPKTQFVLKSYGEKAIVTLPVHHHGYVNNALAASAAAYFLNIPLAVVVQGLETYRGFEGRFEIKAIKGGLGTIINDCYNANPESMKAALKAFDVMPSKGPKIAVLGDMLELGERELYWHRQIGRVVAASSSITMAVLIGERAGHMANLISQSIQVLCAKTWEEAVPLLQKHLGQRSLVLVKGSLGMRLKNIIDVFAE